MNDFVDLERVYITNQVYTLLCPEGMALRKRWLESVAAHEDPEVIYKAMQAYFFHKNGVRGKKSKFPVGCCQSCNWGWVASK